MIRKELGSYSEREIAHLTVVIKSLQQFFWDHTSTDHGDFVRRMDSFERLLFDGKVPFSWFGHLQRERS